MYGCVPTRPYLKKTIVFLMVYTKKTSPYNHPCFLQLWNYTISMCEKSFNWAQTRCTYLCRLKRPAWNHTGEYAAHYTHVIALLCYLRILHPYIKKPLPWWKLVIEHYNQWCTISSSIILYMNQQEVYFYISKWWGNSRCTWYSKWHTAIVTTLKIFEKG